MRKVTANMISAIYARKSATFGNTAVAADANAFHQIEVRLHGNLIAVFSPNFDTVKVTLAGWNTPTTRDRVNAILRSFAGTTEKGYGIVQRDFGARLQTSTRRVDGNYSFESRDIHPMEWVELPINPANALFAHERAVTKMQRERTEKAVAAQQAAIREGRAVPQGGSTYGEG